MNNYELSRKNDYRLDNRGRCLYEVITVVIDCITRLKAVEFGWKNKLWIDRQLFRSWLNEFDLRGKTLVDIWQPRKVLWYRPQVYLFFQSRLDEAEGHPSRRPEMSGGRNRQRDKRELERNYSPQFKLWPEPKFWWNPIPHPLFLSSCSNS